MVSDLKVLKNKAKIELEGAQNLKDLDGVFRTYLGRKGELTLLLRSLPKLPKQKRIRLGEKANDLRDFLKTKFEERKAKLENVAFSKEAKREWFDVSAPGKKIETGHLHPLTLVQRRAHEIFRSMGFEIAQGPEIENEWYNFDALNIPKDHPARDMWDTFWLKSENPKSKIQNPKQKLLLRTHTSPVQIRYMETHKPPLRVIAPGRTFRYEATDAHHEFDFFQLEGLMVGKNVTAANFKAILQEFYRRFFAKPVAIRLRPSFFPFTEPSFEVDMTCTLCDGKARLPHGQNCKSCGGSGWLEMLGAGMVHPKVFEAVYGKDWQGRKAPWEQRPFTGFAFGMGLERLAMMKYKINDIRLFHSGDLRFLQQF